MGPQKRLPESESQFYAFYALGVLFSVIRGPCKRYAVTPTQCTGEENEKDAEENF
jgi:hypothetical protein